MARKPRLHVPGGVYHVMLRGNGGQTIFLSEKDRSVFYRLVEEGIKRFGHRVHGFCLMGNHVHLLIQVADVPLSQVMQNLSFRYTGWINRRHRRTGHLFQGRYKALLVDADAYLLELVRYIHLNPVRARMVSDPAAYRWSGHRAYLGLDTIPWLHTDWVLGQFARRLATCRKHYAAFVAAGMEEGYRSEFHVGSADTRVLGDDDFLAEVGDTPLEGLPPSLDVIIERVCARYGTNEVALGEPSRVRRFAAARAMIGWLAMRTETASLTEVSRRFHRDVTTMSKQVRRLDISVIQDKAVAQELTEILNAISQ